MKYLNKKGDTIIEVILAMAMLSLVLFSSWAITNRASQVSLTARQRVVMVNQLREQAELLKAMNQADRETISKLTQSGTNNKISENPCADVDIYSADAPVPDGAFYIELNGDALGFKNGTKNVAEDTTQRVWIQKEVKSATQGFGDFYVRACWATSGGKQKLDNSHLIVRINT